jgi:hypothetical protein
VDLGEALEVIGRQILDRLLGHHARRDHALGNLRAQQVRCEWINLVVEGGHSRAAIGSRIRIRAKASRAAKSGSRVKAA